MAKSRKKLTAAERRAKRAALRLDSCTGRRRHEGNFRREWRRKSLQLDESNPTIGRQAVCN